MLRLRSRCRSGIGHLIRRLSVSLNRAASIGPYDPPARRYKRFGHGSIISWPTGNMYGERWISIGDDTMIATQVTLSAGMLPGQQMMTKSFHVQYLLCEQLYENQIMLNLLHLSVQPYVLDLCRLQLQKNYL